MENGHCVRTIHAEVNAITQAAKTGAKVEDATMYLTCSPCWACFKMLVNAGIKRMVFEEDYDDPRVEAAAAGSGIQYDQILLRDAIGIAATLSR